MSRSYDRVSVDFCEPWGAFPSILSFPLSLFPPHTKDNTYRLHNIMLVALILPSLLLIIIIISLSASANPKVTQRLERSPASSNSSNTISQQLFDILYSPFFIFLLVTLNIWACYAKCKALLVSARNWLAATFRRVMEILSLFRLDNLFQLVSNALDNPTHDYFIESLSTRGDTLFPRIAAITVNSTNAFIEWLSSQLNPLLRWVADVVESPTFRSVMESLPSSPLRILPGLQWAVGLVFDTDNPGTVPHPPGGDLPVTTPTVTV